MMYQLNLSNVVYFCTVIKVCELWEGLGGDLYDMTL